MSKKVKEQNVTPSQETEYSVYVLIRLAEALFTLKAMGRLCEKCATDKGIKNALLYNAIILYGSIFKYSNIGDDKRRKIDELFVPKKYIELHKRLIDYRDKFVAHFDFDYRKPAHGKSKKGNYYYELTECPKPDIKDEIPEIEQLIQEVLMILGTRTFPAKKST